MSCPRHPELVHDGADCPLCVYARTAPLPLFQGDDLATLAERTTRLLVATCWPDGVLDAETRAVVVRLVQLACAAVREADAVRLASADQARAEAEQQRDERVKPETHAFAVRKLTELSDLVSRIWAAVGGDHDETSIVDLVADLKREKAEAEQRVRALTEEIATREGALASYARLMPHSSILPHSHAIEWVRLLLAALAVVPEAVVVRPATDAEQRAAMVQAARAEVARGATHDCGEWAVCALCDREVRT